MKVYVVQDYKERGERSDPYAVISEKKYKEIKKSQKKHNLFSWRTFTKLEIDKWDRLEEEREL